MMTSVRMISVFGLAVLTFCAVRSFAEPVRCEGFNGILLEGDISQDGKMAAACGQDHSVVVWDASNGAVLHQLQIIDADEEKNLWVADVRFSPDGKELAIAPAHRPIQFWDLATGKKLSRSLPVTQTAFSLAFSPDGSKLAVGEIGGVTVWDLSTNKPLPNFDVGGEETPKPIAARRVAFSGDGSLVAGVLIDSRLLNISHRPPLRVWRLSTGDEVFTASEISFNDVCFSPRTSELAAAGRKVEQRGSVAVVDVWNIETQKLIHRIKTGEHLFFRVAFSPDGKTIATGGDSGDIKLWNVKTENSIGTLKGHADHIKALCFSGNGRRLLSAGDVSKLVLIWTIEPESANSSAD